MGTLLLLWLATATLAWQAPTEGVPRAYLLYLTGTVEDVQVHDMQWSPAEALADYQGVEPPILGIAAHPGGLLLK